MVPNSAPGLDALDQVWASESFAIEGSVVGRAASIVDEDYTPPAEPCKVGGMTTAASLRAAPQHTAAHGDSLPRGRDIYFLETGVPRTWHHHLGYRKHVLTEP